MKKFTAILMTILMILGCLSVMAVSAAETASITVDGKAYTAPVGATLTYNVDLKVANSISNGQFGVNYPQSAINITDIDFPVVGKGNVVFNYTENRENLLSFNFSSTSERYDFSNGGSLVKVTFKVVAAGTGEISLTKETMGSIDSGYVIREELDNSTFTESLSVVATTVDVKADKTKITIGKTTTVKAAVENGEGDTTFASSDSKVATVTAAGIVKGVKAGSAKITATNNGISAEVTIKVVKKANTMKLKGKTINAKAKKNTTFKVAKAITVKSAKGKLTYTKKKGDKKITIAKKTGKITVKKGLKKGKTFKVTVAVKAAGNATFSSVTKKVTFKVKVK